MFRLRRENGNWPLGPGRKFCLLGPRAGPGPASESPKRVRIDSMAPGRPL